MVANSRSVNARLWFGVIVGAAIWIATMASASRVSDGPNESSGSVALWPLLALSAVVLGYFEPKRPLAAALAVVSGPLALALWTAPRGDEDGLWILIIPMLAVFAIVLIWCAQLGGWVGRRVKTLDRDAPILPTSAAAAIAEAESLVALGLPISESIDRLRETADGETLALAARHVRQALNTSIVGKRRAKVWQLLRDAAADTA